MNGIDFKLEVLGDNETFVYEGITYFCRAFDIGGLFLTLHDGSKLYFDNVADKVAAFWRNYFEDSADKDINIATTD